MRSATRLSDLFCTARRPRARAGPGSRALCAGPPREGTAGSGPLTHVLSSPGTRRRADPARSVGAKLSTCLRSAGVLAVSEERPSSPVFLVLSAFPGQCLTVRSRRVASGAVSVAVSCSESEATGVAGCGDLDFGSALFRLALLRLGLGRRAVSRREETGPALRAPGLSLTTSVNASGV